jgi:hypothetical protein
MMTHDDGMDYGLWTDDIHSYGGPTTTGVPRRRATDGRTQRAKMDGRGESAAMTTYPGLTADP